MYDIQELKERIIDYYGTAMFNGFPMAMIYIAKIENMSNEEIMKEARKIGLI